MIFNTLIFKPWYFYYDWIKTQKFLGLEMYFGVNRTLGTVSRSEVRITLFIVMVMLVVCSTSQYYRHSKIIFVSISLEKMNNISLRPS